MASDVVRIPPEEFRRDVRGFLSHVLHSDDRIEVFSEPGAVALVPLGTSARDTTWSGIPEARKITTDLAQLRPPTAEELARHHEAIARVRELGKELLARRGGAPAPSNVDVCARQPDQLDL